jgi:hypothetical protein
LLIISGIKMYRKLPSFLTDKTTMAKGVHEATIAESSGKKRKPEEKRH